MPARVLDQSQISVGNSAEIKFTNTTSNGVATLLLSRESLSRGDYVELAFETEQLRDICESEARARRMLGAPVAKALKRRLADLRAAPSVEDFPLGRPNPRSGTYVFDLADGYSLHVCPNHVKNPTLKSGGINWAKVNHIKIYGIEETK
jgi:hypothetical protein